MKFKNGLKNLLMSILAIVSLLFGMNVLADTPLETFVLKKGVVINLDQSIISGGGKFTPIYFPLKYTSEGNYLAFCSGNRSNNVDKDTKFVRTSFTYDYNGAQVAAIINGKIKENAKSNTNLEDIFVTQLAIWKVLPNTGDAFSGTETALKTTRQDLYSLYTTLIQEANTAKTRYQDIKNFNVSFNEKNLTFKLNGDNYESQLIKVSGKEINTLKANVNIGKIIEKDGGYVIVVDKKLVKTGTNKVTLKVDADSNSIDVARNYTNGKSDQQTLTVTVFDHYSNKKSISITGEIVVKEVVKISKVDATTGKELPNAKLELIYPDGHSISWISDTTPMEFTLEPGVYKLREDSQPDGYIKTEEVITFTVDESGKPDKKVVMKNYPKGKTYISKQDATTGKELPNAKLILKDEKGNTIKEWTSTDTPELIEGLDAGKYFLTEIQAPDGYITSEETIEFEVDECGKVKEKIIMYNERIPDIPNVPKTASFKTITTSIIGIIAIGLGVVIIRKVYKNNEA